MRHSKSLNKRWSAALLIGAALAGTALVVRRNAKEAERRHPPVGRFVEVDGIRLHYLECGQGPTVLLIHGNRVQATDFLACGLMERLASRYRVIAFDRPGYGYSERPRDRLWTPKAQALLLERACVALGALNPIILAHSFGTQVALAMALETGMPLQGLILASGYYFPTMRLDALFLGTPAIPVLGDIMRYTVSPALDALTMKSVLRRIFAPREVPARFYETVPPKLLMRPWQLQAMAEDGIFMVPAAAKVDRRYHGIGVPVEIFAGADDRYVDQTKQSTRLHECIPRSRLHWLPGEGHMLHYAVSGALAEAVDRIAEAEDNEADFTPAGARLRVATTAY